MSGDYDSPVRSLGEAVITAFTRGVWGVKATGLERVPRSGPLIVAFNHVSLLDGPVAGTELRPLRVPVFLAKKELFSVPVLGWLMSNGGCIPLDRGTADHSALRAALEVLSRGGCVALSPEGTRVKPGQTRAPKLGVSFLAAKSRAPVLPARLVGTAEFPRRFPLEVRYGSPLPAPAEGREAASSFARAVMEAIYSL